LNIPKYESCEFRRWVSDFKKDVHSPYDPYEASSVVCAVIIGSLRIDDFFHDDDVGTAESPTTNVQKDVAQG